MSPDIVDRKFSIAIKTAYTSAAALILATGGVVAAAVKLNATIDRLDTDHYGSAHHIRWSQAFAAYNPDLVVPDPSDVIDGKATIREIRVPNYRQNPKEQP